MSEYRIVIEIDIDKEQFDKLGCPAGRHRGNNEQNDHIQSEYQERLLLADYIYTLAEGNELYFQMIDGNQKEQ